MSRIRHVPESRINTTDYQEVVGSVFFLKGDIRNDIVSNGIAGKL